METEVFADDVTAVCDMAHHLQVHSALGMDDGFSGGEAGDVCDADLGAAVCGIREFREGFRGQTVQADDDQYARHQYLTDCCRYDRCDSLCGTA